jgi:hypothetical protein
MKKFFALFHQWFETVVPLAGACNTRVPGDLDIQTMFLRPYTSKALLLLPGRSLQDRAMGTGTSYYCSFIHEPLNLDLEKLDR